MIRKLGIRVQLNTECTPQMLRAMDPYAVFVATGSRARFIPPIDGLSGENVLSVREYIRSKPAVSGKRVVVPRRRWPTPAWRPRACSRRTTPSPSWT